MINVILFYMLMFSDYRIGFLSISDWALIFFIIRAISFKPVIVIRKNEKFATILLFMGIIFSTLFNFSKSYFMTIDFLQTVTKLMLYILAIHIIPSYLGLSNINFRKHLEFFLKLSVAGGAIQRVIVLLFGRSSWPLYSLGGHWFGITSEVSMFTNVGMMRARSFWSEPAHFSVFISLIFILLLFTGKNELKKATYAIYMLGIILANSFAGYGIMIMIFGIHFLNFKSIKGILKACAGGICSLLVVVVVLIQNDYLRNRVINLINLKDHSGVVRTVGGFRFLEYTPWYGVGLGNHVNYYRSLGEMSTIWFSGSGEFYNNILIAIITLGYIGAVGFVLLQYNILKDNKKLFIVLMVTHFGWGKLYTTPIWVFLIIYLILKEKHLKEVGGI